MPLKKKNQTKVYDLKSIEFFLVQIGFLLLMWTIYRSIFSFDVWFDETFGKAVFYGLPIWVYLSVNKLKAISDSLAVEKLKKGLMFGLAIGGIFGFTGTIAAMIIKKGDVAPASTIFLNTQFWWQFFLAMMTAFWETIFFYSFIMNVLIKKCKKLSVLSVTMFAAVIFLIFHLPNIILRSPNLSSVTFQIYLMFLFGFGQALLFQATRNAYSLIISHAIWGMVMFIHLS